MTYQLSDRIKARIYAYLYIELQAEAYGMDLDAYPDVRQNIRDMVEPWIQSFENAK